MYCIGFGSYGSVLIQSNYFKGVANPHQLMYDVYAFVSATDNVYDDTTGKKDSGKLGSRNVAGQEFATAGPFTPPYSFKPDAARDVPALVQKCASPRDSVGAATVPASPPATTIVTVTTKAPPAATTAASGCASLWAQCSGSGYTGPKCCSQGTCKVTNEWYSQCQQY